MSKRPFLGLLALTACRASTDSAGAPPPVAPGMSRDNLVAFVANKGTLGSVTMHLGPGVATLRGDTADVTLTLEDALGAPTLGPCLAQVGPCVRPALQPLENGTSAWWLATPRGARLGWTVPSWSGDAVNVAVRVDGATPEARGSGAWLALPEGSGWTVSAPLAWDATGHALPAELHVAGDTLRVRVDADDAVAPIHIDPDFTYVYREWFGGTGSAHLGPVDGGVDLDDNGKPDVVTTAIGDAVVARLLGATDYVTVPVAPLNGGSAFAGVATMVTQDLNGDGSPEIVVADPAYNPTGGTPSTLVAALWWDARASGFQRAELVDSAGSGVRLASGRLGNSEGEVLAVAVPRDGATATGEVYLRRCDADFACVSATLYAVANPSFGSSVAFGDFDGDGNGEVWVGAPDEDDGAGAVYGFETVPFGTTSTPAAYATWKVSGLPGDHLGSALGLADIGDIYGGAGDRKQELFIGATDGGIDGVGMVRVYFGRNPTGAVASTDMVTFLGREGSGLGNALTVRGDGDGDGRLDLLAGARRAESTTGAAVFVPAVELLWALRTGSTPGAFWWVGSEPGDLAGSYVAFVGDVNGDERDEIAIGSPGERDGDGAVRTFTGNATDADNDGSPAGEDCDDHDARRAPTLSETCDEDDLDEDCDLLSDDGDQDGPPPLNEQDWWPDGDGDGFGDADVAPVRSCERIPFTVSVNVGGDCDDNDATSYPGGQEVCDGADNDCDDIADDEPSDGIVSYIDADRDGYGDIATEARMCGVLDNRIEQGGDCDDAARSVNPDGTEFCDDGVDGDCNGVVDDACVTFSALPAYCGCGHVNGASMSTLTMGVLAAGLLRRRHAKA